MVMPSQIMRVVDQEELVSEILYQTRVHNAFDRSLLFNCLMVNKLWAKVAIQYLWHYRPPIHALTALAESPSLQDYANHVRVLDILKPLDDTCRTLVTTEFPELRSVVIDYTNDDAVHNDVFFPTRFLSSKLRAFTYRGGALSDNFLEMLRVRCPKVNTLCVDNDQDNISTSGLLKYLLLVSSLRSLHFGKAMHGAMSDGLFLHLAQRPDLVKLIFYKTITQRLVDCADGQLFPSLRTLVCQATHNGITSLICHLRSLRVFDVVMQDPSSTILYSLASSCPHLWSVTIFYDVSSSCAPEQLISFAASYPNLRVLNLTAKIYFHRSSEITDDHISRVAQSLPAIRVFKLTIASSLSIHSLIALGKHCRELRDCTLSGTFSLHHLHRLQSSTERLFPHLECLELPKVTHDGMPLEYGILVPQIAGDLCRNAPKLVRLTCTNDLTKGSLGNLVQDAVNEMVNGSGFDSN